MKFFSKTKTHLNIGYEAGQVASATNNVALLQEGSAEISEIRLKKQTFNNLLAIFSSALLGSIGYGMLNVLIAFKLENFVKNDLLISLSAMICIASGAIFAKQITTIIKKAGLVNSFILANFICAFCAFAVFDYFNYTIWLIIIFFFGGALFIISIVRQVIMMEIAPSKTKTLVVSMVGMIAAIGNGFGPILLKFLKTEENFSSFLIVALFYLFSLLPLAKLQKIKNTTREEKEIGIFRYVFSSPKIMFAGFFFNYCFAATTSFVVIYGLRIELDKFHAAALYSAFLFGTIISVPIGYITDIVNRRFVMIFGAAVAFCICLFLYLNQDPTSLNVALFALFGGLIAMRLPAIILINEKYKKTQRLAVNAAFLKFSIMGNIAGIFATGAAMSVLGEQGLWLSLTIALGVFLAICAANYGWKMKKGEVEKF